MSIAHRYAGFSTELRFEDLPPEVVDHTKKLIVDIIANAIGGHEWMESGPVVTASIKALNRGAGGATLFATGEDLAPEWAALLNGTTSHSLDYDNHHARGVIHAGSSVVPAALAAGEEQGASGRDVLTAIVAGYEIACRLAMACNPFSSHEMGFHPTGTCGVFGATAAVGKLKGLTTAQLENAFGINGSQAAGSMQYDLNSAWNKRAHPGLAAHSAFIAVTLAGNGFLGAAEPIEGRDGFLRAYSLRPKPERATEGLGDGYETLEIAIKPYPLCRYTHMTLDQLISLAAEEDLRSESVTSVEVELPTYGVDLVGRPLDVKRRARSAVDAQFSAPFAVALALTRGAADMGTFRQVIDEGLDEEFRRLMNATTVESAEDLNAIHPELWPGRVTVHTAGRTFTRYGEHIKGERPNPMSWDDVRNKLGELAPRHTAIALDDVVDAVRTIEERTIEQVVAPLKR